MASTMPGRVFPQSPHGTVAVLGGAVTVIPRNSQLSSRVFRRNIRWTVLTQIPKFLRTGRWWQGIFAQYLLARGEQPRQFNRLSSAVYRLQYEDVGGAVWYEIVSRAEAERVLEVSEDAIEPTACVFVRFLHLRVAAEV